MRRRSASATSCSATSPTNRSSSPRGRSSTSASRTGSRRSRRTCRGVRGDPGLPPPAGLPLQGRARPGRRAGRELANACGTRPRTRQCAPTPAATCGARESCSRAPSLCAPGQRPRTPAQARRRPVRDRRTHAENQPGPLRCYWRGPSATGGNSGSGVAKRCCAAPSCGKVQAASGPGRSRCRVHRLRAARVGRLARSGWRLSPSRGFSHACCDLGRRVPGIERRYLDAGQAVSIRLPLQERSRERIEPRALAF